VNLSKTFNELWPPAEPGTRLATPNKLSLERPGGEIAPHFYPRLQQCGRIGVDLS
jgi:hypothetical protein